MSSGVLQELSNRLDGKLSKCEIYDANVCVTRSIPDKPWELIPVSGEPFSQRLQSTYRGRRVIVLENSDYASGAIKGMFTNRPLSINAKQKAGFRSEYARTLTVGSKQYPVFTESKMSPDQEALLGRPELACLAEESDLREGESLYFTKGEIGFYFYLNHTTADRVSRVIDRMVDLAARLSIAADKPNFKLLPAQFHPLIPLIERWALGDDSDRSDLLETVPESVLRALISEVEPYLEAIDSYLDSFKARPATEQAVALGRLAECALEAKQRLRELSG